MEGRVFSGVVVGGELELMCAELYGTVLYCTLDDGGRAWG